jgi:alpha-ketoglutarate-dependent 2,4-dichlorophenoxyacetate dioxygenase
MMGADLQPAPTPALVELVESAMSRYAVLVIRGQRLSDEEHIRFSRAFGPLELPPKLGMADKKRRLRRELYDASNLDADGELLAEESRQRRYNRGNGLFHTDSSFNSLPTKWSLLLSHVLPPEGGNTDFIDTRAVYDDLPASMKAELEGLEAVHSLWHSRERAGLGGVTEEMRALMPPVRHPLVRALPSGRKALYIGAHAAHIPGHPGSAGQSLLQELYDIATQPKYIYSHTWRPGDLVIWDNRCTLHRAGSFDDLRYKRDLRRTTINEYGPEQASN